MLTLQYIPYHEIKHLSPNSRINKLLNLVKDDKIILMEGRLDPSEETKLIEKTMEQIDKYFKGIEVCTIYPRRKNQQFFYSLKKEIVKMFLGYKEGMTIIGPATIIKEIRRDPNKIELLTGSLNKKRRRSR